MVRPRTSTPTGNFTATRLYTPPPRALAASTAATVEDDDDDEHAEKANDSLRAPRTHGRTRSIIIIYTTRLHNLRTGQPPVHLCAHDSPHPAKHFHRPDNIRGTPRPYLIFIMLDLDREKNIIK